MSLSFEGLKGIQNSTDEVLSDKSVFEVGMVADLHFYLHQLIGHKTMAPKDLSFVMDTFDVMETNEPLEPHDELPLRSIIWDHKVKGPHI
jgi:hypothetical protein